MSEQQTLEIERSFSVDSIVVAAENQISSNLAGEAVILELNAGMYYGLDPIATRVWSLIQKPTSVSELRDVLLGEYEVESDRCEQDLLVLLRQMADNRLIKIQE
jgi:hypothetical protein